MIIRVMLNAHNRSHVIVGQVNVKDTLTFMQMILLLKVSPELHKDLKILVTLRETTLQDYIMGLIEKDMAKNKEA